MNKIKSIIVDDELANRDLLQNMLINHCPNIEIVASAASADEAYSSILSNKPDLVFLDIKMPDKNGFDLLRMFDKVNFNVIFVSGFDEYAIHAFEFNAVDYILKPIDHTKLILAVNKTIQRIQLQQNQNIIHFVQSIDEKNQIIKKVTIHSNDKVHIIDVDNINCIVAQKGYCEIKTTKNQRLFSYKTLTEYEELLGSMQNFLRVNKSTIINTNFIESYTKGSLCFISLKNMNDIVEVSRRKKVEIVQKLKQQIPQIESRN